MKARELMFGDLVRTSTTTTELRVCRVAHIDGDMDSVVLYDIEDEDEYRIGRYAKHIKPIPLTEEMLKANWFYHPKFDDGTEVKYIMAYDKDGLMWLNKEKDYFFISSSDAYIHIYFVHELQHALRLCGLSDLADNFKIE